MKLDRTNMDIIKCLKDGRKPYSVIAEELDITENTVRSRVNKMIESGVLEITGLIDPVDMPGHQVCILGIKVQTMELEGKAREISKLRGVIYAGVVTGRYDIFVQVLLDSSQQLSLMDFISRELSKVSDIQDVETFIIQQAHNLRVPYIL